LAAQNERRKNPDVKCIIHSPLNKNARRKIRFTLEAQNSVGHNSAAQNLVKFLLK
jgi:hypothetical protein